MITWKDTINLILQTYGYTQQEIADKIGIKKSHFSKVKSGKLNAPNEFLSTNLYKKIFATDIEGSLSYGKNEVSLLEDLKTNIYNYHINIRDAMDDCLNEENYKTYVIKLLDRTSRPVTNISKIIPIALRHILYGNPLLFGREVELNRLSEIFESSNCVVLTGIGGIGKSQIALAYAHILNRSGGWTIQHIICEDSETLQQAILRLQFTDLPNAETFDYAIERLKSCQENTLIILDNLNKPFSNSDQDAFQQLLKRNRHIRILITSRYSLLEDKRCVIPVSPLDNKELLKLYEYHRFEDHSDHSSYITKHKSALENLFSLVERHTLMIVLLAKLPGRCFLDEGEILEKLKSGLSLPTEDIAVTKDDTIIETTISEIIKKLFDISQLDECQKAIMMYMLVIPASGIDLMLFTKLTDCRKRDIVRLKKSGWVIIDEEALTVRLHPLICEAVLNLDEAKAFWHFQNSVNSGSHSCEEDICEDDEDSDISDSWSITISEPNDQSIDELRSRFENKDAGKFIKRVLTKRKESLQGEEEWHLFNQIMACFASRVVFRHLLDSDLSEQIPFSIVDLLSDENRDALITINKAWTEYVNTDSENLKYMVRRITHKKDSK